MIYNGFPDRNDSSINTDIDSHMLLRDCNFVNDEDQVEEFLSAFIEDSSAAIHAAYGNF